MVGSCRKQVSGYTDDLWKIQFICWENHFPLLCFSFSCCSCPKRCCLLRLSFTWNDEWLWPISTCSSGLSLPTPSPAEWLLPGPSPCCCQHGLPLSNSQCRYRIQSFVSWHFYCQFVCKVPTTNEVFFGWFVCSLTFFCIILSFLVLSQSINEIENKPVYTPRACVYIVFLSECTCVALRAPLV